jgi:hypothetical protein
VKGSSHPPIELLRRLLRLDPVTGKLYWLIRTPDLFRDTRRTAEHACANWNSRYAGKEAFTSPDGMGYLQGRIFDKAYRAHVVVFALYHGRWPEFKIDHRDVNRSNNRPINLREASNRENSINRRKLKIASSIYTGVSWRKDTNRWSAYAQGEDRKQVSLGCFPDERSAAMARDAYASTHYGEFARLNLSPEARSEG